MSGEAPSEADLLALLDEGDIIDLTKADDAGFPRAGAGVAVVAAEKGLPVLETSPDELADMLARASLVDAALLDVGEGTSYAMRFMTALPGSGAIVPARAAWAQALGDEYGGKGPTSAARLMRVKLSNARRPAAGPDSASDEPDLEQVVFPGSYVFAPFLATAGAAVLGDKPTVYVGVARVQDMVTPTDDGIVRPEYVPPGQFEKTTFFITFQELAGKVSHVFVPARDEVDDVEVVAPDVGAVWRDPAAADAASAAGSGGASVEAAPSDASKPLGCFASPYAGSDAVRFKGSVILAKPVQLRVRDGDQFILSFPTEDVAAAAAYFSAQLETLSQRALLDMKPSFKPNLARSSASLYILEAPTALAREAVVPERCLWLECTEKRFADKANGVGVPFGMFKHVSWHAALASVSAADLDDDALVHAANACGVCGSSSAGCVIQAGPVRKGVATFAVTCYSSPFNRRPPSFGTRSKTAGKNVPVKCPQCSSFLWSFGVRPHFRVKHEGVDLPPAPTEAAIAALKTADRVKVVTTKGDDIALGKKRARAAQRRQKGTESAAKRPQLPAPAGGDAAAAAAASSAAAATVSDGDGDGDSGAEAAAEDADADGDSDGEEIDDVEEDDGEEAAPAAGDEGVPVDMPSEPKFKVGQVVANMGLLGAIAEVVLACDATEGHTMYKVAFTNHKGAVKVELCYDHQLTLAEGRRERGNWKNRFKHLG